MQIAAFEKLKTELAGWRVLTHFDEKRALFLATDASEYGVGVVLFFHKLTEVSTNSNAQHAK